MERIIDLRSDTVTKPSIEMRKVMMNAEVGDDVYREDPTVNMLEEYSAELTGKESSLFVSSGTMGNLLAVMVQAKRGTGVLMHKEGHTMSHELSGISYVAGCQPIGLSGKRGIISANEIETHINPSDSHYYEEQISMIIIENTHNFCGGSVWSKSELSDVHKVAKHRHIPLHMDGARIFNASVASTLTVKEISDYSDTVTFCLSKSLGAPMGSMLCGDRDFIKECLRLRKMLGGGMRQIGIMAAAGIYALKNNIQKVNNDHIHAKAIAKAFDECSYAKVDGNVETNILFANTTVEASDVVSSLAKKDILCFAMGEKRIRMVTHLDITDDDTDRVCNIIKHLY